MIRRIISHLVENTKKSVLVLGPRQVGKSTLIRALSPDLSINLANQSTFIEFASNPASLEQKISATHAQRIMLDEVQRLPSVLNTVQALLDENKNLKFYITGSSVRKLKRGKANLLPGRLIHVQMGPFVSKEAEPALVNL